MGTKTSSPLQTAGLILITFFCIWIGKKLVDRMENSEWRQNLKSDADKVREQVKMEKEQKQAIDRVAAQSRTQTATLGDRMPKELLERLGNAAGASDEASEDD